MPFMWGATRPMTAFAATAASAADPPRARIIAPACAASGLSAATIPCRDVTTDRPCERPSWAINSVLSIVIPKQKHARIHVFRVLAFRILTFRIQAFRRYRIMCSSVFIHPALRAVINKPPSSRNRRRSARSASRS